MRFCVLALTALAAGVLVSGAAASIPVNTIADSITPASTIREDRFTAANGSTIYYTNPFDNSTRFVDDLIAFDLAAGTTQEVVSDTTFVRVEANDDYLVYNQLTDGKQHHLDRWGAARRRQLDSVDWYCSLPRV